MARQYQAARRRAGMSSITYWRKFAQHRLIYFLLAGIFGISMVAYFGGSGPMGGGAPNARATRGEDVIATVNGEPITRADFDKDFDKQYGQIKKFLGGNDAMMAQFQGSSLAQSTIKVALARSLAKQKNLTV